MKTYSDSACTNEVKHLNFGVVPAGETKTFEFYVKNDTNANLVGLKFGTNHDEIRVVQSPTSMKPNESAMLVLEWAPSVTLKEGLDTQLSVEGREIWGEVGVM